MKTYFAFIRITQEALLAVSVAMLATLPTVLAFNPDLFTDASMAFLYAVAHTALFFVMMIRPLSDLFPSVPYLRPLVILRKGAGVLSASVIVSFLLAKVIVDPSGYLSSIGTGAYWSLHNLALFAHLGDLSAVVLLATSNALSKRVLGKNWKRVQRLSYVYFYASALYVTLMLHTTYVLVYVVFVTLATVFALLKNRGLLGAESYTPKQA
ncbi:MAG TPA: hypothetical protein VFS75_00905 [Candidatus Paceibacterota bacterium]|nr:hypothetical protein [Candidatus Paceibacterota bacterium]